MTPDRLPETQVQAAWRQLWKALLIRGCILVAVIVVLGVGLGWLFAGQAGLNGALIGGGLAAVFLLVSLLIMYLGRNLSLTGIAGFLGVGFLFKAFIFMIVISRLAGAPWLNGTVAFFTIVAAVLGTSLLDALSIMKARIPYVDSEAK